MSNTPTADPTGAPLAFAPLSLADLFALELPEPDWVVEGLLPLGAAGLLSAREKAGKGLLTIDLCAAVALEEPFLGRAVRAGTAVYCAAEEHLRDVRGRIATRLGERRDAPLLVLPLDGSTGDRLDLDDPVGMQKLWGMVAQLDPVLVVLDTLRELHGRQEDKSDEMGPVLRPLRQLAHQTETALLVNHHQNKMGGFRGSTAIRAAFDLEWAFQRTDDPDGEGPPRGVLRVEGRHGPRQVARIKLGEDLRWEPDDHLVPPRDPGIRERILAHLVTTNTWQTARELAVGLGVALKTVQNVLAEVVQDVPRPVAVRGAGTKTDPRCYHALTPTLDGFAPPEGQPDMIPPAPSPSRVGAGGNQAGDTSEAGHDRWTR